MNTDGLTDTSTKRYRSFSTGFSYFLKVDPLASTVGVLLGKN